MDALAASAAGGTRIVERTPGARVVTRAADAAVERTLMIVREWLGADPSARQA